MGKVADSNDGTNTTSRARAEASQTVAPPAGTSKTHHTRQTEATKFAHDGETTRHAGPFQPQRVPDQANVRREARPRSSGKSAPGAELPRKTAAGAARTASTESAVPSTLAAIGRKRLRVAGSSSWPRECREVPTVARSSPSDPKASSLVDPKSVGWKVRVRRRDRLLGYRHLPTLPTHVDPSNRVATRNRP